MSAILDYLTGSDDPATLAQAVAALRQPRGGALRALLADQLTCDVCQPALVDYAQVQELALPLSSDLQAVEQHLRHCPQCQAAYHALQTLSDSAADATGATSPVPAPNLAFLQDPALTPAASAWWRQGTATQQQLLTTLQIWFHETAAWFTTWPQGLTPQLVPAPLLRGAGEGSTHQRLILPAALGDLHFELTTLVDAGLAQLRFGVFQTAGRQPVSQVTVTLLNGQRQRLQRRDTGADGLVTFADLPAGAYYLQARLHDNQWELTVEIQEAPAT